MRGRWIRIASLILALLALAACNASGSDEGDPIPTPNAGTPVMEATPDIAGPSDASPFEGEQVPGDPPQEGEVDSEDRMMSSEEMFGAAIPLPEGATPVDSVMEGDRASRVSFEVDGMTGEEIAAFFEAELPAAGYTVEAMTGGEEENRTWSFSGNGISGTLAVVDEADASAPGRFTITLDSMGSGDSVPQ